MTGRERILAIIDGRPVDRCDAVRLQSKVVVLAPLKIRVITRQCDSHGEAHQALEPR